MPGKVAAVIVAAGRGYRAGGDMPKQYRQIAGEPVIRPTLLPFSLTRRLLPCSPSFTRMMKGYFAPRPRI